MAATTTPSIGWLRERLLLATEIHIVEGEHFGWNHDKGEITIDPDAADAPWLFLHEIGHAVLDHKTYSRDIELIAHERDAWEKARELANSLMLEIPEDTVQDHLDTYRDWMHARSTCPTCEATGFQSEDSTYSCIECKGRWRVNDAKTCQLKRYSLPTKNTSS